MVIGAIDDSVRIFRGVEERRQSSNAEYWLST